MKWFNRLPPVPRILVFAIPVWVALAIILLIRLHDHEGRKYTCAEILGTPPEPGYAKLLPPSWSFNMTMTVDKRTGLMTPARDFRVWDRDHRLVCDKEGKDVPR